MRSDRDIVIARQEARRFAATHPGFSSVDLAHIITTISELARNIVLYAGEGEIVLTTVADSARAGITVVARDQGPGIPNIRQALQDGYSTSGGLGLGLPGVRRLMDDFEIVSEPGRGTTVTAKKWHSRAR